MPKPPAVQLPFLISSCLIPRVCDEKVARLSVLVMSGLWGLFFQGRGRAGPCHAARRLVRLVPTRASSCHVSPTEDPSVKASMFECMLHWCRLARTVVAKIHTQLFSRRLLEHVLLTLFLLHVLYGCVGNSLLFLFRFCSLSLICSLHVGVSV